MKKGYNIIITSNSGDFIKSFTISYKRWKIMRFLLILFFFALLGSALFYGRLYLLALKARSLEVENRMLREENAKVVELEKKLMALEELRAKIYEMLGVDKNPTKEQIYDAISSSYAANPESGKIVLGRISNEFKKYAEILYDDERFLPRGKPVDGYISQRFGGAHQGIDFVVPIGTPVKAPADGIVTDVSEDRYLGLTLTIKHGSKFETRYGHLKEVMVKVGHMVKRGDVVALSGNSGISTGPHLHYEIKYLGTNVDPEKYLY